MTRRIARVAVVPPTTRLKLFRYPHKFGGGSSWCVGLERSRGGFVSQSFLSEWSEDHAVELERFERWATTLGCEGSREDRE